MWRRGREGLTVDLLYKTRGAEGEEPMVAGGENHGAGGARWSAVLLVLAASVRSAMVVRPGIWTGTGAGEGARASARVPSFLLLLSLSSLSPCLEASGSPSFFF